MNRWRPAQWLFSAKLYLAAMLAYAVSVHMALPQSYWAVVTCCVVMSPSSGAIRSKSIYRGMGTFCGGVVALLLTFVVAGVPLLMVIGVGGIAGAGFGLALLDRTPRAYGFQLFAVTLLLIVTSGIDHPEKMFDTAVARICEIWVGLACCAVVDSVLAPRSLGLAVRGRLHAWFSDMANWMDDALLGQRGDASSSHDRHRIIADLTSMSILAGQLSYDPGVGIRERGCVFAIQRRLLRLVPLLSSVEAYSSLWPSEERCALSEWKAAVARRARQGLPADEPLLVEGRKVMSGDTPDAPWKALTRGNFRELVSDVLLLWAEIRQIQAYLTDGRPLPAGLVRHVSEARPFPLWPDFGLALRVSVGILIAYSALCGLWWATGWTQGANAVLMGVVALAFFGTLDEAGRAIGLFLRFSMMGLALAGILSFGLLPLAQNYETFLVVMAIVMLPLGAWAASSPLAILLLAIALSNSDLQAAYAPRDFGAFLDACLATLIGIAVGQWCIGFVRFLGTEHMLRRLAEQERKDVKALTRHTGAQARDNYMNRSLDRIGNIVSRRPAGSDGSVRLLSRLRAGVAVSLIQEAAAGMGVRSNLHDACEAIFAEIRRGWEENAPPQLLLRVDDALSAAWRMDGGAPPALVRGLVGLRVALFERSSPWEPSA
ncbi:FUSC family protein [Achromobacter pulmonis]|nr:FUSC family protein [Achromobacter pulmonis]